jgi:hypothetical protein
VAFALSDLFKKKAPAANPAVNPKTGQPWADNDPENPKNKNKDSEIDPATGQPRQKSQVQPLDAFKGLWDTSKTGGTDAAPSFSLDPEQLSKLAKGLNFTGQVPPELVEKLKSGDTEALLAMLNTVGQNAYATMMSHMPQLTEQYVSARVEHSQKGLGKQVKGTLTAQSLSKLAEDNPVLQEQLQQVGSKLLEKYPDADPDWLAEQTVEYFKQTASLLTGSASGADKGGDSTKTGQPAAIEDWSKWMVGEKQPQASPNTKT